MADEVALRRYDPTRGVYVSDSGEIVTDLYMTNYSGLGDYLLGGGTLTTASNSAVTSSTIYLQLANQQPQYSQQQMLQMLGAQQQQAAPKPPTVIAKPLDEFAWLRQRVAETCWRN